jgi:hypothetical protein
MRGVDAKTVLPYNPACRRRDAPRCFPLIDGKSLRADDLPGNRIETLVSEDWKFGVFAPLDVLAFEADRSAL